MSKQAQPYSHNHWSASFLRSDPDGSNVTITWVQSTTGVVVGTVYTISIGFVHQIGLCRQQIHDIIRTSLVVSHLDRI